MVNGEIATRTFRSLINMSCWHSLYLICVSDTSCSQLTCQLRAWKTGRCHHTVQQNVHDDQSSHAGFSCEPTYDVLTCSSEILLPSEWITTTTASGKTGKSFVTYREASITAGSPESTGRIDCSRCTWQAWTPSRRRFASMCFAVASLCVAFTGWCRDCDAVSTTNQPEKDGFKLTFLSSLVQQTGSKQAALFSCTS